jgi:Asp-tRNA(Asn)/Glu-tRNA(Gln) amidotransferase A subunit family amidase
MLILRRSPKHNVVSRCSRRYSSVSDFTAKLDNTTFFPVESRHRSTAHSLPRRYGTAKERAERCVTDDGNAFISYNPDATYIPPLAQALRNTSDRYDASIGQYKYKYQSISVAVKDNICTLGSEFPTSCASRSLVGHESPYEATVVTLLKMRGCKVVGKTNMDEFGMGSHSVNSHFGPVAQRYTNAEGEEVRYSAGGSSGGSAVAVQQMLSTAALGTDTGGSVRLPAAWCGVVGFKPSYGLLSRWGVIDYANSFDTVGILARTVTMIDKIFRTCLMCQGARNLVNSVGRLYMAI